MTCAALPGLDPDDQLLAVALADRGVNVEPAVWDAPLDWARYDLVVIRSSWDYPARRDEFVAWAWRVPRLANPAEVVAWNTDKRYLDWLGSAGVPVVDTTWVRRPWSPPSAGKVVVKPAVGAGGVDSGRYDLASDEQREMAGAHVSRLVSAGRLVMVQPYLSAIDTYGETALVYLGGRFSHAIRKDPLLTGPDLGVQGLYREERILARQPSAAELAVADRVLGALPFDDLLYARVDLVPGPGGEPVVIEVELTEPSLFLGAADAVAGGAADRLATEIVTRIQSSRTSSSAPSTTPTTWRSTSV